MTIKSPDQFTQEEVNMWLVAIGLGSKVHAFQENSIDGTMLMTLTEQDLTNLLGMTTLQARKLQKSLQFSSQLATSVSTDERTKALEAQNKALQKEVANLKAMVKALQDPSPSAKNASKTKPPPAKNAATSQPYVSNPSATTTTTTQSTYPQSTAPPYDPYAPQSTYGAPPPSNTGKKVVRGAAGGAAKGALLGVIGGAITGNAGKGAAVGAAVGGTGGAMRGFGQRKQPTAYYY